MTIELREEDLLKAEIKRLKQERVEILDTICGMVGKRYRELEITDFSGDKIHGMAVITLPDGEKPSGPALAAAVVGHVRKHVDDLAASLAACMRDRNHWKANHDTQVLKARVLSERPDLPLERIEAFGAIDKLVQERDQYKSWMELGFGRDQRALIEVLHLAAEILRDRTLRYAELLAQVEEERETNPTVVRLRAAITTAIADLGQGYFPVERVIHDLQKQLEVQTDGGQANQVSGNPDTENANANEAGTGDRGDPVV